MKKNTSNETIFFLGGGGVGLEGIEQNSEKPENS